MSFAEIVLQCSILGFAVYAIFTLISPFIQHFILRYCLWREGSLPLRLVHFLNYATDDLRFLERDGGSWRFRHQILQDYFTALEKN